jgi:hypothetical protein
MVPSGKPRTKPVSSEVFDVFKRQLAYAKKPVDLRVESTDTSSPDWIKERVSVGSGADRTPAVLFLPRNAAPPFQLTVFFPGLADFVGRASSENIAPAFNDYLLKSGRAMLYPVWKGSYERWDPVLLQQGDEYLTGMRTRLADWRQDLGRLLDGLEGRKDIDISRTAYLQPYGVRRREFRSIDDVSDARARGALQDSGAHGAGLHLSGVASRSRCGELRVARHRTSADDRRTARLRPAARDVAETDVR